MGEATARVWFIAPLFKASTFKLAVLALGGYVKEGYYWIQHNGVVQVAYYTNDTVDDLESGQLIVGIWHLTRGDDICHNGEAEVLSGPLQPPA